MGTKKLADDLVRKHETRDPFRICEELGILVFYKPLGTIGGVFQNKFRVKIIFINEILDEDVQRFTCAHELYHALEHTNLNKFFLGRHTNFYMPKFEADANKFAVDLLYDDYDLQAYLEFSPEKLANDLSISYKLAEYRLSTVEPRLLPCW